MSKIVYHGSPNKFTQFSYDSIGDNGTSEGIGFYCTDNKTIAKGYACKNANNGYLYTIKFNGKKSLSSDKLTITKAQLKKYLLALQNVDIDFLSNYGDVEYEGLSHVITEAVNNEYSNNTNDVDLICSICHSSGNIEGCLTTLYETLHYDSIILPAEWGKQELYIALVNECIKILNIEKITK